MLLDVQKKRIEFGDFQTPKELAQKICQKLLELEVIPDNIIEPTCGIGSFIESSAYSFPNAKRIIGVEINQKYLKALNDKLFEFPNNNRIELINEDFFKFEWEEELKKLKGSILIVGNFPWVTNSQQGVIGGDNLPEKLNFQNHSGF